DLTSTTLSSVEVLKAATTGNTTFTVDAADLLSGGSVQGFGTEGGNDTLTILGTSFDLRSTTLSSVEKLVAATAADTVFTVDANDLIAGGSVLGDAGTDTLRAAGTTLDLSSTTLSAVEIVAAGLTSSTVFTIDANDTKGGLIFKGSAATAAKDTLAF